MQNYTIHDFSHCHLCPRQCAVDRNVGEIGYCRAGANLKVARAALHFWEEPCLSGKEGSGAVFFSGCSLQCTFCQNQQISRGETGKEITVERLCEIFLELQQQQANNINLVTAAHYIPQLIEAIPLARAHGLRIPILYNSSGYERVESLRRLAGKIDIYLPDFKYMSDAIAIQYSHAPQYSAIAKAAIAEMVRQVGNAVFDERGMMQRGVIVRHLLLPAYVKEAKAILRYLYKTYGDTIYISIMNQYTPLAHMRDDEVLGRAVTAAEYDEVVDYAVQIGVENGFIQEGGTVDESFIPEFNNEGV